MDFFTHMLVGYLVALAVAIPAGGTAIPEGVFLFGVLMAMLPDFDVIFFPLARRFPMLRHHGITHTVPFIVAASGIGAVLGSRFYGLPLPLTFAVGLSSGLSHLVCDWFTNFSIPAFYPFTKREYSLDAENAVNIYVMPLSILTMIGLWQLRVQHVSYAGVYLPAVGVVGVIFLVYCAARLVLQQVVARRHTTPERRAHALATMSPGVWFVELRSTIAGTKVTQYVRHRLLARTTEPRFFELDSLRTSVGLPIDSDEKAVAASAAAVVERYEGKSDIAAFLERGAGCWSVTWFQWRFGPPRDVPVLRVEVGPDGIRGVSPARLQILRLWS